MVSGKRIAAARLLAAAGLAFGLAGNAAAQGLYANAAPIPEEDQGAWNAVGRLNQAGWNERQMCTATLVAPDKVLTAAHCVYDFRTGKPSRPSEVHFVAGWRGGPFAAHRKGAQIRLHPDYDPGAPPEATRTHSDLAIMTLDTPIPDEIAQPIPADVAPGEHEAILLVGYRRDRPHLPSLYDACPVTWRGQMSYAVKCRVIEGSSGGPVVALRGGEKRVVGVISSYVVMHPTIGTRVAVPKLEMLLNE
ncbi:V8-like Glu-specific endopeptidase [Aliiruegeria haliotis]|uniref:V8-like Glu-specific endopeptidase n=1 Tax=Aliiruegeria haliotis TaxID=1280846 RepID=A0A2T0RYH9_9RHOB|nr:trypsin-like serine protease [Aliiruegeria haliotis]PRY26246.1 V8-like Glu-specific endopeptidase [Aliiruegeria haliotis]